MEKLKGRGEIYTLAKKILLPRGFVYNKEFDNFFLAGDKDAIIIAIGYTRIGIRFYMNYSILRTYKLIEEPWVNDRALLGWGNSKKEAFYTLCFNPALLNVQNYDPFKTYETRVEIRPTPEEIRDYFVKFENEINTVVYPLLDKLNDIREMDRFLNDPPEAFIEKSNVIAGYGLHFRKMIIARYAGNPNYELVCKAMYDFIYKIAQEEPAKYQGYLTLYHKVYEALKDVKPLENTQLSPIVFGV